MLFEIYGGASFVQLILALPEKIVVVYTVSIPSCHHALMDRQFFVSQYSS